VIVALVTLSFSCRPVVAGDEKDLEKIKSFVFTTLNPAEKEAEIKKILDANPKLATASDADGPILTWTLSNLGMGGEVAQKSRLLAEMLISKGADVNLTDKDGMPLLVQFAMFGRIAPMEFLLSKKADVNAKDQEDGRTALHWVALLKEQESDGTRLEERLVENNLKAATMLIKAGAAINATDKRGTTPLHSTAFLGNARMTELLIAHGADLNLTDAAGYSTLGSCLGRVEENWANEKEKAATKVVIDLLKKKGAKDIRPKE
jgi:ankyrin repeat protein